MRKVTTRKFPTIDEICHMIGEYQKANKCWISYDDYINKVLIVEHPEYAPEPPQKKFNYKKNAPRKSLNDDDIEEILAYHDKGYTVRSIATILNLDIGAVDTAILLNEKKSTVYHKWTEDDIEIAFDMYCDGKTAREIADFFRCSVSSIKNIMVLHCFSSRRKELRYEMTKENW